ncbi:MAG: ThiF family adenylyltransferase [Myxococcota bacterium]
MDIELLWEGRDDERLNALHGVQRRDLVPSMQREYQKISDPSGQTTPPAPPAGPWVYYHWIPLLVRIVEREPYRVIRTSRNRDVILADEQERLAQGRVGIVGLSVGHAMARTLALEGVGRFRLIDGDELELSNLNRVPQGLPQLGLPKAIACARRLYELDPYLDVDVWPGALDLQAADDFLRGLDVVVDACDAFPVKMALRAAAARQGIPLVMETSFRGLLDLENYRRDPDHQPFHGVLEGAAPPVDEDSRVAFFDRLIGPLDDRVEASLRGLGRTHVSYPQTGSDIMLGGASIARLCRALLLGEDVPSGRWRMDLAGHMGLGG